MRHHLQVARCDASETTGDLRAACSCGGWSRDDPRWTTFRTDGYGVREDAWGDFEAHVLAHEPTHVRCYHVVGWYPNIPYDQRRSSNLSDGAIFSARELAREHVAKHRIHILRIEPIMLATDDPQVDHLLRPV